MMKLFLKQIIPNYIWNLVKSFVFSLKLLPESMYWHYFTIRYGSLFRSERGDLAGLMVLSHVLEKGITMPNRRLGFGYDRVRYILRETGRLINDYTEHHIEIQSTLKDLEQYLQIHEAAKFELPNDIHDGINELLNYKKGDTISCFWSSPDDFFKKTSDFREFAHQRHSVRWYSDKAVDDKLVANAIELAMTSPSACNRQSTKVYVISTKEKKDGVLKLQNGNRGFGQYADKVILITSDMRCWSYKHFTSNFLDAGIFLQNLLYALHFYKICACTLNANLTRKKRRMLKQIVGYGNSEIPVVFISIGNPPDNFMIAGSQRINPDQIYTFV